MSNSLLQAFRSSSHLAGGNAAFVEDLFEQYLADPKSVAEDWRSYFDKFTEGRRNDVAHGPVIARFSELARMSPARVALGAPADSAQAQKQAAVLKLITAYRSRGHLRAQIDPLGMLEHPEAPDLELEFHGLDKGDLEIEFETRIPSAPRLKLKALVELLRKSYCASIGAEYMHITVAEQRKWLQERIEKAAGQFGFSAEERRRILERLTAAEGLERYLHTKYVGQKRFSLEGGDSLIPMLDELIRRASSNGAKEIVMGMAHRGRLNVLINTLGKSPRVLFDEFEGNFGHHDDPDHSGDVKYHMGFSSDLRTPTGSVHLALGFNPSHLEIVDPVIVGSVRARQTRREDNLRSQVLPVLMHGDAAFAGQGVVMELFNMSQARGFAVGGTVHIVINNQVGFTTSVRQDARSTLYCTDVAKMVQAPVLHVNGDDPEAVLECVRLAYDFRETFKQDVVIDLVCYRRHGHNEADEPAATQPRMYQVIRARKTTRELYALQLEAAGVIDAKAAKAMVDAYRDKLDAGQPVTDVANGEHHKDPYATDWTPYLDGRWDEPAETGLPLKTLQSLAAELGNLPSELSLHPRVAKIYEDRVRMAQGALAMDWGFAENLAYATLLDAGYKLRLVGQDCGRGTFFHRHAALHDQNTDEVWMPLSRLAKGERALTIIDSLLSEEAVMGFEYGYATADPQTLVIWEGQFGDFANGAQVVIDQFITSGYAKWGRLCGLTLFLPHGYEGQGPEHSSARLERFLQLCAQNNIQVCVPTTPAQMFHMLRRQMVRKFRAPLVVMTPKSMLRHKLSVSAMNDLANGGFQLVIPDSVAPATNAVDKLVLCSGKVYYDLVESYERLVPEKNVAIIRVEQLYPFPRAELKAELARYPGLKSVIWCQEEPMNQGAWFQIRHHLQHCVGDSLKLHYAGRARYAAPACGHFSTHVAEQSALVEQALTLANGSENFVE